MGCQSCKDKKVKNALNNINNTNSEPAPRDFGFRLFSGTIRLILFSVSLLLVPIIILFVIYLLFKTIILNRGDVNLMPALLELARKIGIGKKKTNQEKLDDNEDLESANIDDYEIDEKVDKIEL